MKHALTVKQSLLYTDLSVLGNKAAYFKDVLGIDYQLNDVRYLDGRISWNYDGDIQFNRALLNSRTLDEAISLFVARLQDRVANLMKVASEIHNHADLSQLPISDLAAMFKTYADVYLRTMPFLFMFWNVEKLLTKHLEQFDFSSLYPTEEIERIFHSVLIPSGDNYIAKERQSLLQIAVLVADDQNLRSAFERLPLEQFTESPEFRANLHSKITEHLEQFSFTSTAFHLNPPLTKAAVLQRVKQLLLDDPHEQIDNEQKAKQEQRRAYDLYVTDLKSFPQVAHRVRLLRDLLFWKNERIDIQFLCDYRVRHLFEQIASHIGITLQELVFLTYREIEDWFTNRVVPVDRLTLQQRAKGYDYLVQNGNASISTELELADMRDQLQDIREIKGQTANPGKAQGVVRVIFDVADISKINKGDILVTPMTRPEMIVGLENAAAFVTDQGGRLCHAAIVSREMNKPCIVGTEIATQVLKDDQLVEVDADQGVVRLIG